MLGLVPNSGTPLTQTIPGGTVVNSGHTDIHAVGAGTITLSAGAIARSVGGTADFTFNDGPTFTVTTSTGATNGLLGSGASLRHCERRRRLGDGHRRRRDQSDNLWHQ